MDAIDDHDDVQAVYSNINVTDELSRRWGRRIPACRRKAEIRWGKDYSAVEMDATDRFGGRRLVCCLEDVRIQLRLAPARNEHGQVEWFLRQSRNQRI